MMSRQDRLWMQIALEEAKQAALEGEVPVGAALIWEDRLIAAAHNRREGDKNVLSHAELLVIGRACNHLGGWRLHKATLYVTLEPCPMCAGAIVNARIARVVFGARDPKAGCLGSAVDFCQLPFNHTPQVTGGVLEEECSALLRDFFRRLRQA